MKNRKIGHLMASTAGVLASALALNGVVVGNAAAALSSYEAIVDTRISLVFEPQLVSSSNPGSGFTEPIAEGDGQYLGSVGADSILEKLYLFLRASGEGTGSSSIEGFASLDLEGPDTGEDYLIEVVIDFNGLDTNIVGDASAFAFWNFEIPGATATECDVDSDAWECWLATGAVTATLSGTASGSARSAAVPEPATLALFGLGLAGIGAIRRKKLAA